MNYVETMKQALEFIKATNKSSSFWLVPESNLNKTVTALHLAIEQAEKQEPVAWANKDDLEKFDMRVRTNRDHYHTVPLYTVPPQRQPLTEEEIDEIWRTYLSRDERTRAIERKHGITGDSK